MKKGLIALVLALLLGTLSAASYSAAIGNTGMAEFVDYGEGLLDCYQNATVTIETGETKNVKTFICCNNYLSGANLSISSDHPLVTLISPSGPSIPGGKCHDGFNVHYDASGFSPDTYEVVFNVSADIGGQTTVNFNFTADVVVTP